MEYIISIIVGIAIGVGNLIPGLSGGSVAVMFGKYTRLVECLSNLFSNIRSKNHKQLKEDIKFIVPILIGLVIGVLAFAKLIEYLLLNYELITLYAFAGLVIGSIPNIFKKANKNGKPKLCDLIPFFITLAIALTLAIIRGNTSFSDSQMTTMSLNFVNIIILLFWGIVAAGTMVVPGISGSLVLMIMGGYSLIIGAISTLTTYFGEAIVLLLPFGIGCIIGIFLFSKIIDKLLKKSYVKTYYGILGFLLGSIICLITGFSWLALLTLILGAIISFLLTKFTNNEKN